MVDEQLIQELGIENLTPEQQEHVVEELNMQVGEALSAKLTAEQLEEYQQIIDGNEEVIAAWLSEHVPDYKDNVAYQQLAQDNEGYSPEKMFAYLAWVQLNNPDLQETVARVKQEIRENIDSYK